MGCGVIGNIAVFGTAVQGSSPCIPTSLKIGESVKNSYTIVAYNTKTQKYSKPLAEILATSQQEAKDSFAKTSEWAPKENVILVVKPPICR